MVRNTEGTSSVNENQDYCFCSPAFLRFVRHVKVMVCFMPRRPYTLDPAVGKGPAKKKPQSPNWKISFLWDARFTRP